MRRIGWEAELQRMQSTIGNSATARRQASQDYDPAELAAATIVGGGPGAAASATNAAARLGKGARARAIAREESPYLMLRGAQNIDEFLRNWEAHVARPPLTGQFVNRTLPGAAAVSLLDLF
jgi:hypothetical protein